MKRSNFLKSLLITGAVMIAVPSKLLQIAQSDDDRLDEMVKNGVHITDEVFYLHRSHDFNGSPCFLNKSIFHFDNDDICIYVNYNGSIVTNNIFYHSGIKFKNNNGQYPPISYGVSSAIAA